MLNELMEAREKKKENNKKNMQERRYEYQKSNQHSVHDNILFSFRSTCVKLKPVSHGNTRLHQRKSRYAILSHINPIHRREVGIMGRVLLAPLGLILLKRNIPKENGSCNLNLNEH
jgi:hypothetical protein